MPGSPSYCVLLPARSSCCVFRGLPCGLLRCCIAISQVASLEYWLGTRTDDAERSPCIRHRSTLPRLLPLLSAPLSVTAPWRSVPRSCLPCRHALEALPPPPRAPPQPPAPALRARRQLPAPPAPQRLLKAPRLPVLFTPPPQRRPLPRAPSPPQAPRQPCRRARRRAHPHRRRPVRTLRRARRAPLACPARMFRLLAVAAAVWMLPAT